MPKPKKKEEDRIFKPFDTRDMAEGFEGLCEEEPMRETGAGLRIRALISIACALDSIAYSQREILKLQRQMARARGLKL